MSENWRPAVGYEGAYEVSDLGGIRSLARVVPGRWNTAGTKRHARPIKATTLTHNPTKRSGHHRVHLSRDGSGRSLLVHILVLEAFVGPRPDGMHGCHNDGDVDNNQLSNLRWDTPSANMLDRVRHGNDPQANQTACISGHLFDEANTYVAPNGSRHCRRCRSAASLRWQRRRAAERSAA